MPWEPGPGCGFTTGRPWLPIETTAETPDVLTQANDSGSMLSLYRALTHLRRSLPALSRGGYKLGKVEKDVLSYERYDDSARLLIALNMTENPQSVSLNGPYEVMLSTFLDGHHSPAGIELRLRANEGLILRMVDATG
jgi:glycosidase